MIVATLLGIVIEARLEQPLNVYFSMIVTLLGIVIEARLEQPSNAL